MTQNKFDDLDLKYKREYNSDWNFVGYEMRRHVHGLHDYPAMMMPNIISEILNEYASHNRVGILDPYMGSGTTIVEAQIFGANKVTGFDLNPLAALIAKVKTTKYDLPKLKKEIDNAIAYFSLPQEDIEITNFSILQSWFYDYVIEDLGKIKYYITHHIEDNDIVDFFNVSFSHAIRAASQTRNGEFKLYRMSKKQLSNFKPDAIEYFLGSLLRNIKKVEEFSLVSQFKTEVDINLDDSRTIINRPELHNKFDFIITSPPYGDSHTTVAYGQFSRLMNEWLGVTDANRVDRNLLGGNNTSIDVSKKFGIEVLDEKIDEIKANESHMDRKRISDVVSFYNDYQESIEAAASTVKKGGYVVYVVGNRRVRNIELPTDAITVEMFKKLGFEHEKTIVRDIINKRMPSKASPENTVGGQISTMMYEYIVILRRKYNDNKSK